MTRVLTPAPMGGIGAGILLLGAALAFGRVELAVTGVVLLVAVAAALPGGAAAEPVLTAERGGGEPVPDGSVRIPVTLTVDAADAETILVTTTQLQHRVRRVAVSGPVARIPMGIRSPHTGDQELLAADATAIGPDGAWTAPAPDRTRLTARLQPRAVALPFLPLSRDPAGLTGAHDAARPGDGGEFRDIHPFAPGDRLQRIDWKATARLARRPGDLFVRRAFATSDLDVALILDDRDDVTGRVGDWARGDRALGLPGSMDVAREAAWSLACGYLDVGDQVAFQLLSRPSTAVRRGSGARHRERLRAAIAGASPQPRLTRTRTPLVARGALIILLSTFLDDETVRLAGVWRAAGHRVLAVDTLPQLRTERLRREEMAASRMVLGLRADRLRDLAAMGADVLVWDGDAGSRAAALRGISGPRRRR
ncbi:DUF58 domain-containing protein [Microbacterium sp. SYP-A9085]|uniref:DUF58 domain-containing protein n=1 Tax=Microbacterium sp. SYP-A9085 TaxID=2664454 RepID=UPI00129B5131|nr:DUF58 domain-containing protein [Microbacterium sp. SYP-A9085]MRH30273.1 DUF58 domain-containing protein [Microbacterium sp. SYP-A9085]